MTKPLALAMGRGYSSPVLAKSRADLGRSNRQRRTSAQAPAGAFLLPVLYGGCARDTFGCAGLLLSRSANPRTAVTLNSLAAAGDGSKTVGALPMHSTTRSRPSQRASAWRALAVAALRADSSLAVRLARYNAAMARARQLDTQEASA